LWTPPQDYGGICDTYFFKLTHTRLVGFLEPKIKMVFDELFIAYRELLAVLLAIHCFAKIVTITSYDSIRIILA